MAKNPRLIDLAGRTFGRWTVRDQSGNSPRGAAMWLCVCECGSQRVVLGSDLRSGKSVSCGCIRAEVTGAMRRTHAQSGSRLYLIWQNMRRRCRDEANPNYGGRGISVCAEWADFASFQQWALANGYADGLEIERRDNDIGYEPNNCTFTDDLHQSNNRRFVRKMSDGRSAPLVARQNSIPTRVFSWRVFNGWFIDEAATHPVGQRRIAPNRDTSGRFA